MGYNKPITNKGTSYLLNNYVVTYQKSTLIIPHARIFNESSVALSHERDMIAAIVVPPGNHGNPEVHQVKSPLLNFDFDNRTNV